jgi:hypothetical protein
LSINNEKIAVRENKTLKLSNVLCRKVNLQEENGMENALHMFDSYIKANSLTSYGPLIVHSKIGASSNGELNIDIKLMFQIREDDYKPSGGYEIIPVIRKSNCLFARFSGNSEEMHYASTKLNLIAYENDIELSKESFTIYLEQEIEKVVADIFIPTEANS